MQVPVFVEPISGNCFRAKNVSLDLAAEGPTRDAAVARLEQMVKERVAQGTRFVTMEVPGENPWLSIAGIFEHDPLFDEWQEAIREYRRQVDEDPAYL